jgi:hypothetical protein
MNSLSPWLEPSLLRRLGWSLLWAFGVLVLVALLPFTPRELAWGERLSGVVADTATLPLVGLLLLRAAGPRDMDPIGAKAGADADQDNTETNADLISNKPPQT